MMIRTGQNEKRRYTRVIFNEHTRVHAVVFFTDQQDTVQEMPASVLNMSEGGVQISIERRKFHEMRPGDTVLLSRLTGVQQLKALKNLSMQVIWMMDNEYLEHILLGMSFSALTEKQRGILCSFVENRLALAVERGTGETSIS